MKKIVPLIAALVLATLSLLCRAETRLHITTGFTSPVSDFYRNVLAEADKRLPDVSISFEALPAERSLILVNQGINDGECCRFPAVLTHEYENLVPVNTSFFSIRFSVFTKKSNRPVHSFEALKPFTVGSVEGWKIAVEKIKAVKPAGVYILTTPEQLFQMMDLDRIDYGVFGYLSGLKSIAELHLNNIQVIEPPLVEAALYLMLNRKHKDLVPVFDAVIKQMKRDGTIDRLYRQLIESLQ